MIIQELFEKVNDKVFWQGFEKEKLVLDGEYKLDIAPSSKQTASGWFIWCG